MVGIIETWIISFLAGVYTPLGAACVLPLYPGFLAFLAGQTKKKERFSTITLGVAVTGGAIGAMLLFGLIFVYLLHISAAVVLSVLGPAIYLILALMSIGMILGFDIGRIFPSISSPSGKNPYVTALFFGAFFGLVALPCNPASIIMLFALSTTTIDFMTNFVTFIIFGTGMATPLLALSILSAERNRYIISFLTKNHMAINRLAGVILQVSWYS